MVIKPRRINQNSVSKSWEELGATRAWCGGAVRPSERWPSAAALPLSVADAQKVTGSSCA